MSVDITKLEENLEKLVSKYETSDFIFSLMEIYGFPKATITLLKKNPYKTSKNDSEIILKNKFAFRVTKDDEDEHYVIDSLLHSDKIMTHKPRFIIVTDFKTLLAIDIKTKETLDIEFVRLPQHYTFFLPWTGREKYRGENESPADVKAATKMAKLYDQLIADDPEYAKSHVHDLNLFLTRILFCFFAEDSGIFPDSIFSNSVASHTSEDGTDFKTYLEDLFQVLNLAEDRRQGLPAHLLEFPYVNGGLFQEDIILPAFSKKSRALIIESAKLDWSEINPDIFGSMIQAVTHPGMREDLGMHYTSVVNILKVINPLFIEPLREEMEKAGENVKKLTQLRERISKIRIFDPACGSGNFLIISYKKLCELEIEIINRIQSTGADTMQLSGIPLNNFYGIEIDDFAHEVARLSLWLAQHQMNKHYNDAFGFAKPTLPLKESGRIECGNATRLDWSQVCPQTDSEGKELEIYIIGNPPYEGSRKQKEEQKSDLKELFKKDYKSLDYIAAWFYKGSKYISNHKKNRLALVSTNSIVQGEQVALIWPRVLNDQVKIIFAHQSFKWKNLAKNNAGVTCVIIGLGSPDIKNNKIYTDDAVLEVEDINPYLTEGRSVIVNRRPRPLSDLPPMIYGNMPLDGNYLKLNTDEKNELIETHPNSQKFIRPLIGGDEFLKGNSRYCLWIENSDLDEASKIPFISERIEKVRQFRADGGDVAKTLVNRSHQFRYRHEAKKHSLIVPRTSSEFRDYLQCGLYDKKYLTLDSVQVIYDAEFYIFGLLSSHMHMVWTKAVGGRLQTGIRYSSALCYNTFPVPKISEASKQIIENQVFNILDEREKYPDSSVGDLYNNDKMPDSLLQAHKLLDKAIESIYQKHPFQDDSDRLTCLLKLYEQMLSKEDNK